ncbi:PIN domain-containing protein [Dyadobacter sp. 3J3]|uniref:PIN domain-containing protein n=1 Tax=Dyadobacter sp. 3J3 TaxID=2606600 RepID=UPI00135C52BC|nr:hypothetical protein [Dyadobacter sp. 3J3]
MESISPSENKFLKDIENISVRISTGGVCLGSAFLMNCPSTLDCLYLVTARHCIESLLGDDELSIDRFDYAREEFGECKLSSTEFHIFNFDVENKYDLALIKFPKALYPFDIPNIILRQSPTKGRSYSFRGFPSAYRNSLPDELEAKCILTYGSTASLSPAEHLEDNTSIATGNVGGFSGSGLYSHADGMLEFVGIVTKYKTTKRFEVCTFRELNTLLSQFGESAWNVLDSIPQIVVKETNTPSAAYYEFSKTFLDKAEQLVEDLQPAQALVIAKTALENISNSILSPIDKKFLLAKVKWTIGLANSDLNGGEDTYGYLIEAYKLSPNNLKYQERAAVAFLHKDLTENALELAEQILANDENNARAWAVMATLDPEMSISPEVFDDPIFKVAIVSFWSKFGADWSLNHFKTLFGKVLAKRVLPLSLIPRAELPYWNYLAQFAIFDFLHTTVKVQSLKRSEKLIGIEQLRYAADILQILLKRIEESDLRFNPTYVLSRYDLLLCQYYLYDKKDAVLEMYQIFMGNPGLEIDKFESNDKALYKKIPERAFDLILCLLQIGENSKALNVIAVFPDQNQYFILLFQGRALERTGKVVEGLAVYRRYLESLVVVREVELENILDIFNRFLKHNKGEDLVACQINPAWEFEYPFYGKLIEAYSLKDSIQQQAYVVFLCDSIYDGHSADLSFFCRGVLSFVYWTIDEPSKVVSLLENYVDLLTENQEHRLYILSIWKSKGNSDLLLKLLGQWRTNFSADLALLDIEMRLYHTLRDHEKVEIISEYGLEKFPGEEIFLLRLLESLNWQKKITKLQSLLNDDLLCLALQWRFAFSLGNLCFIHGKTELGLRLYYKVLKDNPDDQIVKEAYVVNLIAFQQIDEMPYPEVAQEGMVVRLLVKDRELMVELTPENIKLKTYAKQIIGKRINDVFAVVDAITGASIEYKIAQILDKYRGQMALYTDYVAKNPEDGIKIRALKINEESPEGMIRQFQEMFGVEGTKTKIIVEAQLNKFANGEIGFSHLFRSVFRNSPINAWNYITSSKSDGYPMIPIINQEVLNFTSSTEFVLDFSTLFTVFYISQKTELNFLDKPFIISQLLKDYLQSEFVEHSVKRKSKTSISFTIDKVTPIFRTDGDLDSDLSYLSQINEWINQNCRVAFASQRLSMNENRIKTNIENDLHDELLMDTMLLSSRADRILITDELLFYKNPAPFKRITLENYLVKIWGDIYQEKIVFELVKLNYRGLTISGKQLYKMFESNKILSNPQSEFFLALNSFTMKYNPNPLNLVEILKFVKELYSDGFSLGYKHHVSQLVLQFPLRQLRVTNELQGLINIFLSSTFDLLGNHFEDVREDLVKAIELVEYQEKAIKR